MHLIVKPQTSLTVLSQEMEVVVRIEEGLTPEVYVAEGHPHPDRHLLLGIIQAVAVAIQEKDRDMVEWMSPGSVELVGTSVPKTFSSGIVIGRSTQGRIAAVALGDHDTTRRLGREALRWFTSTIRLDIP